MAEIKRKINTDKCIQCLKCEEVCKTGAITIRNLDWDTWLEVDPTKCNSCDDCYQVCDNGAIEEDEQ